MLKKMGFLFALLFVATCVALPAPRRIGWNPKERPRLPLAQAMQIAHETLNMNEGLPKDDDTFYCLGGGIAITSSRDGDWTFSFGSKENGQRWVIVDLDGVAAVRNEPQFWY
jgi:hypothetical protein